MLPQRWVANPFCSWRMSITGESRVLSCGWDRRLADFVDTVLIMIASIVLHFTLLGVYAVTSVNHDGDGRDSSKPASRYLLLTSLLGLAMVLLYVVIGPGPPS